MDSAGLSGLAAVSSSSQTLQATNANSATASSATDSGTSSTATSSTFYSSPVLSFDTVTGALIWEYRDTTTGEFQYQSPSRATLLYEQSQQLTQSQGSSAKSSSIGRSVTVYG